MTRRAAELAKSSRPCASNTTIPSPTESITARARGEKAGGSVAAAGLSIICQLHLSTNSRVTRFQAASGVVLASCQDETPISTKRLRLPPRSADFIIDHKDKHVPKDAAP